MMRSVLTRAAVVMSVGGALGCVGANNASLSTVVEALEGARAASPYVEAYIQYVGPDAKWAGPALWTLHVSARDGVSPLFEVTPALPKETRPVSQPSSVEVSNRAPASALGLTQMPAVQTVSAVQTAKAFSTEEIRERLAHLATAVQVGDAETQACSTAIKVRLTRADGSVLEKQGCRASPQWSQVVSEFSAEMIGASRYVASAPAETAPVPAVAPAAQPAESVQEAKPKS